MPLDQPAIRGRGASGNVANRFEEIGYVRDDEYEGTGWQIAPETRFFKDASKSIIAYNDSPDVGFNASVNPYRGCEHGCVYCYARPTHEYLGFSAGLDFESRIMVKEDAPELLRKTFQSDKWIPQTVALSGNTDPYQPGERRLKVTRRCLEVFTEFRNPVGVVTKNALVTRDVDLLQSLAEHNAAAVYVSITTLDVQLNRALEPRSSLPNQRVEALRALSDAGIPAGVMVAPVIPAINDSEIKPILEAAYDAGARTASYIMLRLPHAVAPLFETWLEQHYPLRKEKVLHRLRDLHGGKLYDATFGERMRGKGEFAQQVEFLFNSTCKRLGFNREKPVLSTAAFRRPGRDQMTLF